MAVYFIRAGEDGPVKIGYSAKVGLRLAKIQSDIDRPVAVINQIDGGIDVERWAHHRFRACRLRGEWFEFDNAMHTVQSEIEGVELMLVPAEVPAPQATDLGEPFDLAELEAAFGNRRQMAIALGLPLTTVYTWFKKGTIPAWRHELIRHALQSRADGKDIFTAKRRRAQA